MYIRRKVFSSVIDEETGEERLFSTTEFINEDTYLEQREYADKDEDKKAKAKKIAKKAGIYTGAGVGAGAAGIAGSKLIGSKIVDTVGRNYAKNKTAEQFAAANRNLKLGQNLQKPADAIIAGAKKGAEAAKNSKAGQFTAAQLKQAAEFLEKNPKLKKGLKYGGAGVAGAAILGTGAGIGYKVYKNNKAKKEAEDKK